MTRWVSDRLGWCGVGLVVWACLAFAGCADDKPADGLATIGDDVITQADFDRWIAPRSAVMPYGDSRLLPPRFAACVAAAGRNKDYPDASKALLRRVCRLRFTLGLSLLIERRWLEHEADRLDVEIDEQELRATVRAHYEQTAGGQDGASPAVRQGRRVVRQDRRTAQLARQVRERLWVEYGGVSEADVERYDRRYPNRFASPATREVRILAASPGALRALRDGRGWQRYAAATKIDTYNAVPETGRTTLFENNGDDALLEAVFSTPPGQVGGPVRALNGRFVFVVDKATPRSQSRAKTREQIKRLLRLRREARILRDFNTRYLRQTECKYRYRGTHHCGGGALDQ